MDYHYYILLSLPFMFVGAVGSSMVVDYIKIKYYDEDKQDGKKEN